MGSMKEDPPSSILISTSDGRYGACPVCGSDDVVEGERPTRVFYNVDMLEGVPSSLHDIPLCCTYCAECEVIHVSRKQALLNVSAIAAVREALTRKQATKH